MIYIAGLECSKIENLECPAANNQFIYRSIYRSLASSLLLQKKITDFHINGPSTSTCSMAFTIPLVKVVQQKYCLSYRYCQLKGRSYLLLCCFSNRGTITAVYCLHLQYFTRNLVCVITHLWTSLQIILWPSF